MCFGGALWVYLIFVLYFFSQMMVVIQLWVCDLFVTTAVVVPDVVVVDWVYCLMSCGLFFLFF